MLLQQAFDKGNIGTHLSSYKLVQCAVFEFTHITQWHIMP